MATWGAIAGLVVGGVVSLVWLEGLKIALGDITVGDSALFVGLGSCLVAMIVVSFLTKNIDQEQD